MVQDMSIFKEIAIALSLYDAMKSGVGNDKISVISGTKLTEQGKIVTVDDIHFTNLPEKGYFLATDEYGTEYGQEILGDEWLTKYDATPEFLENAGLNALAAFRKIYETYKDDNAGVGTYPLTPYSFFSEVCPQDIESIQTLFSKTEDYKTFDSEKFDRYMDARDRDLEAKNSLLWKTGLIGVSALAIFAVTSPIVTALEAPDISNTVIYDSNDERASMGGGPSSSADYSNLASGTTIPITVEGYGLNSENYFDMSVLYPNGDIAWQDTFIPGGNEIETINAFIPANAPDGVYKIVMDLDQTELYDLITVDEFGLVTPPPPQTSNVPEFPTIVVPMAIMLGILGISNYKRKE